MYHHVTVVLAGAAAHFMSGWILSNDMLLGRILKDEKDKKKCLSKDMHMNMAAQFAASLVLAIAVAVAISIFEKSQVQSMAEGALEKLANLFFSKDHSVKNMMNSVHTVLFIWAGFIVPTSAGEVIWCGHNWKNWITEMIMELIGLVAIAATVTYLS